MSKFSAQDYQYMTRAIALAKRGHFTTSPNPRVGCVIVKDGKIVGEGFHQKAGEPHAEVYALRMAGANAEGATAYVTLEPCSHFGRTPPCAQALTDAKVAKVVAAMVDPNPKVAGRGLTMLADAGIEVAEGLLEQEARALNPGFIQLMETKRAYVRCKLAASLDGQTAMASGESKWITESAARRDVQRLRAQSCAIISSAKTVVTDNAKLTVRHSELGDLANDYSEGALRQPVRVIIDSKGRLTPDLALFSAPFPILIVTAKLEKSQQWPHFVEQIELPNENSDGVNLDALISYLSEKGLNDLFIEAGAGLAGAFIEQNLVDELILYQAPKLMGQGNKGLVSMPNIERLADAKKLKLKQVTQVGNDIKVVAAFTEN